MFTTIPLLALLSFFALFAHAQKFTTTVGGQTLIETVSVDQWDETWTMVLTTVGVKGGAAGAAAGGGNANTAITTASSKTDVFSAAITSVTKSIPAGTIANYASYQSSVNVVLASQTNSALAVAATVSGVYGINANTEVATSGASRRAAATGVSVAACLVLAIAAGALVMVI